MVAFEAAGSENSSGMHHDRGVFDAGWREKQEQGSAPRAGDRPAHSAADDLDRKWVEIHPTRSVRLRFYWSLFSGSVLLFFTLLVGTGHYAKTAGPHSVLGMMLFGGCILIALACLGLSARYWFVRLLRATPTPWRQVCRSYGEGADRRSA